MIELFTMKNAMNQSKSANNTTTESEDLTLSEKAFIVIFVLLYIVILFWALEIAININGKGDKTALAVHLMFAFYSPMLYVLCYLLIPGFGRI
jgi:hypothetical protein